MDNKKTLVLGGSPKPERFSNKAIIKLRSFNHEVISIGQKQAMVGDVVIETSMINFDNIHTITIYLGPNNQVDYYDYLLGLGASRIIFNPGTENKELSDMAKNKQIEVVENCTLVMLDEGLF